MILIGWFFPLNFDIINAGFSVELDQIFEKCICINVHLAVVFFAEENFAKEVVALKFLR